MVASGAVAALQSEFDLTADDAKKADKDMRTLIRGTGTKGKVNFLEPVEQIWTILPDAFPKIVVQAGQVRRNMLKEQTMLLLDDIIPDGDKFDWWETFKYDRWANVVKDAHEKRGAQAQNDPRTKSPEVHQGPAVGPDQVSRPLRCQSPVHRQDLSLAA